MKFAIATQKCLAGEPGTCLPRTSKQLRSLEAIVQDYIDRWRDRARCELKYFAGQRNLTEAIRVAALAINCDGKKHPHQWRIPKDRLEHYRRGLLRKRKSLKACKNFHEVMGISQSVAAKIWKRSELTVYDTTHRIGAFLKQHPALHAGTRKGARALIAVGRGAAYVFPKELPSPLRRLKPSEIEDCLCIYKGVLKKLAR